MATKKPNMTKYMAETYRDLQAILERTHEHIDMACDDGHDVIPAVSGSHFDLLLSTRDRLVAMVMDMATELDAEARDLYETLQNNS